MAAVAFAIILLVLAYLYQSIPLALFGYGVAVLVLMDGVTELHKQNRERKPPPS